MKQVRVLVSVALLILLSACSVTPSAESEFYMLSSSPLPHRQINLDSELVIIGPITMANYLKRTSIVTPISEHKYKVLKLDQWAGNLESEFQMALVKNLSVLDAQRVYVRYPSFVSTQSKYNLRVDVLRFDSGLNGQVRLEVSWAWMGKNKQLHAGGNFSKTLQAGSSLESSITAQSELLKMFSQEVLSAL